MVITDVASPEVSPAHGRFWHVAARFCPVDEDHQCCRTFPFGRFSLGFLQPVSFLASYCGLPDSSPGLIGFGRDQPSRLLALLVEIVLTLRRGEVGLDIVAALSMTAALVFGEAAARSSRGTEPVPDRLTVD